MSKSTNQPPNLEKHNSNNNENASELDIDKGLDSESKLLVSDIGDTGPEREDADNATSNTRPKGMDA